MAYQWMGSSYKSKKDTQELYVMLSNKKKYLLKIYAYMLVSGGIRKGGYWVLHYHYFYAYWAH